MNAPINSTTPIIIASKAVSQKITDPALLADAKDAASLMIESAQAAAKGILLEGALSEVDNIAVCQGMWPYNNPAALIKQAIGAEKASTSFTKIGVLQQDLISQACLAIQSGKKSFCLVTGGEAKYRDLIAGVNAIELPKRPEQPEADETVEPAQELWLSAETDAGLGMPVGYYALMDSAYQAENNLAVETHRHQVASLYHQFSEVASRNPDAWKQKAIPEAEIKEGSDENPMLAFPYTKRHNSSWNVDQACAILICSTEKAKALGVDPKHWIFPLAATAANQMLPISERTHLARCPGAEAAANALFDIANISPSDIDLIELYSCFPIGVLSFAKALNLGERSDLTTTGGMPFAGGPLNNFVLQSTVKTLEVLAEENKSLALVSNISGMNTKQGLFLYGRNYQPFAYQDVTEITANIQQQKTVQADFHGKATIIASTILFQKNTPERTVIIAETEAGIRAVAFSQEADYLSAFQHKTHIGDTALIEGGQFTLA